MREFLWVGIAILCIIAIFYMVAAGAPCKDVRYYHFGGTAISVSGTYCAER